MLKMISANARLTIRDVSISDIIVVEYQKRYTEKLLDYMQKSLKHPDKHLGLLFVVPSDTHPDMYALLDGHHKFCAYIMTGRNHAKCVVIEDEDE